MTVFFYCFREREQALDIFEMVSGERMTTRYFRPAAAGDDIPAGLRAPVRAFLADMPKRIDEYEAPADQATRSGWSAPRASACCRPGSADRAGRHRPDAARLAASTTTCARRMPYCGYEHYDFEVPVGTNGDAYDRYLVRMLEMRESLRIIEQALDAAARGAGRSPTTARSCCRRAHGAGDLDGGADPPLQARDRGLHAPRGRGLRARSSRRAASSASTSSPTAGRKPLPLPRARASPSSTSRRCRPMAATAYLADLIAMIGSLDIVLGEVDR